MIKAALISQATSFEIGSDRLIRDSFADIILAVICAHNTEDEASPRGQRIT